MSLRPHSPHPVLKRLAITLAVASTFHATAQTSSSTEISPEESVQQPAAMQNDIRLNTVVVTASGFEQNIKNAPASISVITREQLQNRAFNNLGDALEDVEGIDVVRGGKAGGMNISIRGMPSDYTLILIDGKRLNQSSGGVRPNGFGDVDTNFIPPLSAIERIEVVRGPMSTLYGSDAMGGVINIITRKVSKTWTGTAQVDGTLQDDDRFGNTAGTNFYITGPLKEDLLGLSLKGSLFHRDGSDLSFTDKDGTRKSTGFNGLGKQDSYTAGIRFSLTPDKNHDFIFDADTASQTFSNRNGELGTLNSAVKPNRAGGGYERELEFTRNRYSITHNGRWNFGTTETSLLYDTTDTKGRTNPMSYPRKPTDGLPRTLEYDNIVFDTKLTAPLMNDQHLLTIGGQYWKQELKDTLVENPQHEFDQYQWALFAENEWRISDPLALTLGIRYDENEQFGGHWSPRAYLVWNTTPEWTLKGGVSQGYKTPRINQMVNGIIGFGGQGTIPLLGNADLKPETSTTSEIGTIYDNKKGFNAALTLFHTDFDDKIESQRIPNCRAPGGDVSGCLDLGDWSDSSGNPIESYSKPMNISKVEIQGIEMSTKLPLAPNWNLNANYTYTDSEQKSGAEKGHPLGSQPRHMINAKLTWSQQKTTAWVGVEYRAEQYNGLRPDGREHYYNPYTLVNLGGSYKVNSSLSLSAVVYNLFDKEFMDYKINPLNPSATSYTNRYYQILEGRRLWLAANLSF